MSVTTDWKGEDLIRVPRPTDYIRNEIKHCAVCNKPLWADNKSGRCKAHLTGAGIKRVKRN